MVRGLIASLAAAAAGSGLIAVTVAAVAGGAAVVAMPGAAAVVARPGAAAVGAMPGAAAVVARPGAAAETAIPGAAAVVARPGAAAEVAGPDAVAVAAELPGAWAVAAMPIAVAAGGAIPAANWPRPAGLAAALGTRRGTVVLVDPQDGRILGVAGGLERLREAAPPGSVAKIVTAYAALEAGITDSSRRIACTGLFAGRTCGKAHGSLTLRKALARSCNVHFLNLGAELGSARLSAAARKFGFGTRTGADPAENPGAVAGSALDLAYGVGGFVATPLQLARAMAAVANGGRVLRLHVGEDPSRGVGLQLLREPLREPPQKPVLLDRHLVVIRAGLRAGTREESGTARALAGLDVAGKTGTAVFDPGAPGEAPQWYGHFAGYAPIDGPAVVAVVRVEGRSAAHDAVPVARAVFGNWRSYQVADRPTGHERDQVAAGRGGPSKLSSSGGVSPSRKLSPKKGQTRSGRTAGERTIRVLLWAAWEVGAFEILAPGALVEAGGDRLGLPAKRVRVRIRGGRPSLEIGPRLLGAERIVIRSAPGNPLGIRPVAARRRGLPDALPDRRISGAITFKADRGQLIAVAAVPLDGYAAAVAAGELGPGWPAAAVAAQSVLARTYAIRHRDRHSDQGADVCDLTHCQVFKGDLTAGATIRRALAATAGAVLTSGGEPIEALYHAACGGLRLGNEEVFGGEPLPYLRGGPDPWCARSPRNAPWRAHFSREQLTRAFAADSTLNLGTVTSVKVTRKTPSGAPASIEIDGSLGTRTVPAYQVWRDLGTTLGWSQVKSVRFNAVPDGEGVVFLGRGLGHSVGMCQWGARAQAQQGAGVARILSWYYPGTRLEAM